MSWFKKSPPKTQLVVITRDQDKLRLADFRADEKLCIEAGKILGNPTVRLMLDVLNNEHLALFVLPANATLEERAARQAQIEGYTMALGNLESMGKVQLSITNLIPTFEKDNMLDDVANQ